MTEDRGHVCFTTEPNCGYDPCIGIDHPYAPGRADRWNVYVTDYGVKGCTGSFRWRWRARIEAHKQRRYWPGPNKIVTIEGSAGRAVQ